MSMGPDSSVLRCCFIELNVKVYHKAGKGWTNVISTFVTERNFMHLCLLTIKSKWHKSDNCIQVYHMKTLN